jgi:hypothetical protein
LEFEDRLVVRADVDAVFVRGNDYEREIAWVVGRGDGFAEAFGKLGELLVGEAVNASMFDRDDVG